MLGPLEQARGALYLGSVKDLNDQLDVLCGTRVMNKRAAERMRSRSLRISRVHKPFLISWIGRSRDTVSDGDINELGQLGERQTTCGTSRGEREGVPGAQWDAVESTKRILDEGRLHREMKGTPIVGGEAGKKPRRADENASQSRPRPGAWPNTVAAAQTTPAPSSPPSRNSHLSPIGPRVVPGTSRCPVACGLPGPLS